MFFFGGQELCVYMRHIYGYTRIGPEHCSGTAVLHRVSECTMPVLDRTCYIHGPYTQFVYYVVPAITICLFVIRNICFSKYVFKKTLSASRCSTPQLNTVTNIATSPATEMMFCLSRTVCTGIRV
jgi:hypothetical protein